MKQAIITSIAFVVLFSTTAFAKPFIPGDGELVETDTAKCAYVKSRWQAIDLNKKGKANLLNQVVRKLTKKIYNASDAKAKKLKKKLKKAKKRKKVGTAFCRGLSSRAGTVDLENASALAIAPRANSSDENGRALPDNAVFKITNDGFLLETSFTYFVTDEDGNLLLDENQEPIEATSTSSQNPIAIHQAGDFFVLEFGTSAGATYNQAILVRKSDGAAFDFSSVGIPIKRNGYIGSNGFKNDPTIDVDSDGNLYTITYKTVDPGSSADRSLYRIEVGDPENLTATRINPEDEDPYAFTVTPEGHVVFNSYSPSLNQFFATRLSYRSGGFASIGNNPGQLNFWLTLDGTIQYIVSNPPPFVSKEVTISGSTNEVSTYGTWDDNTFPNIGTYNCWRMPFEDRLLMICNDGIYEVENPSHAPRSISGIPISSVQQATQSSTHYYLSGTNEDGKSVFLKVNPEDDSVTSLMTPDKYSIYTLTVTGDGSVIVNALRLSDAAKVVVSFDSEGNESLIDEDLNQEVIALERI